MGSKGGKAKQQIAAYQMSLHLGFCYSVDKLLELFVKEKSVWKGSQSTNTELTIDQKNLFGGPKKEGGLLGAVSILQGRSDQVLPTHLATRLGRTPSNSPGFRDILSLFFYGAPGQGFLWSHNYPYLHTVWAKVQRIFQSGWYSDKAALVNPGSSPAYDSVTLNPSRDFDAQNAALYPESSVDAYTVSGFRPDDILRVSITQGTFRAWSRWSGYGSGPGDYPGSTGYPLWWCAVNIKTAEGAITQHFDISGMTEEEAFALNSSTVVELTGSTAYTLWLLDHVLYNRGGLSLKVEQLRYSVGDRDMNPAHIIRECLTNTEWGMALPGSAIDDTSFTDAANVLYDEGFGLSLTWSGQSYVETFVNEILGHIDATYGTDPETGKFFIKLIRGGYDVGVLPELTEDNCRIIQFNRKGMGETTNEVVVTWTNPANEGEETVTVHDLANYSAQGVLISSSRNYYGIRSASLAIRVALRELNKASQPLATFEVEANRVAWRWKSGDVIKVTYPEYGLNGLPCRITNINYGKPGTMGIRITLIEDVFDMPSDSYVVSDGSYWEPPTQPVLSVTNATVTSAPYFAVARTAGDSIAEGMTYPSAYNLIMASGYGSMAEVYAPNTDSLGNSTYTLTNTVSMIGRVELTTSLTPEVVSTVSFSTASEAVPVAPGVVLFVGDDQSTSEVCIVESVSGNTATVRRGMLDTVPATWPAGTVCRVVNWDDFPTDGVENIVGGTSSYRIAPPYLAGVGYVVSSVTYDDRMYKPYRPAYFRINGSLWPTHIVGNSAMTWVHRNRLLETSVPLKWNDSSVTVEPGVSYTLELYGESGTLKRTYSGLAVSAQTWSSEAADCGLLVPGDPVYHTEGFNSSIPSGYATWRYQTTNTVTAAFDASTGGVILDNPTSQQSYWELSSLPLMHDIDVEMDFEMLADYCGEQHCGFWLNTGSGDGKGYRLHRLSTVPEWGVSKFNSMSSDVSLTQVNDSNPVISLNTRYRLRATWDAETGLLSLYRDDVLLCHTTVADNTYQPLRPGIFLYGCKLRVHEVRVNGHYTLDRLNNQITAKIKAVREGYVSHQAVSVSTKRVGYGYSYGESYGGI